MRNFLHAWWCLDYLAHRKMIAFWSLVVVALPAPWVVTSCSTVQPTAGYGRYDNCQVLNVHDGDTMTVSCQGEKIKLRLYCIDAPELGQEPWGIEARDRLRELAKSEVRIDPRDHDRYGRQVSVVWRGSQDLNLEMVREGLAVKYAKYCNDSAYADNEHYAESQQYGVWRAQGLHQRPWVWRANVRNH